MNRNCCKYFSLIHAIKLLFCRKIKTLLSIRIMNKNINTNRNHHAYVQGDIMSDMWQHEKNLTKAAKILGEKKSHLHARESTAKTKVLFAHQNIK